MNGGGGGVAYLVYTTHHHERRGGRHTQYTQHIYNICTMLDQRRRLWADVVQMLYKCFVFAGHCGAKPKCSNYLCANKQILPFSFAGHCITCSIRRGFNSRHASVISCFVTADNLQLTTTLVRYARGIPLSLSMDIITRRLKRWPTIGSSLE